MSSSPQKAPEEKEKEVEAPASDNAPGAGGAAAAAAAASTTDSAVAAGGAAAPAASGGQSISKMLSSTGPVVKAVLLRHMRKDGKDPCPHRPTSPKATISKDDDGGGGGKLSPSGGAGSDEKKKDGHHHHHARIVLTELIDEIELDTTPSKSMVKEVLGGPFTFLGQYESEGIVVMARREIPEKLNDLSIHKLRELCNDWDIETGTMVEKTELVDALEGAKLPVNPHRLQPPLDKVIRGIGGGVRGDILIMKVAGTEEEFDDIEGDEDVFEKAKKELKVISNEEFFLDYTKDEYVAFASRTDIVAPPTPPRDPSVEGEDDEDEDDEDYDEEGDEDEDDDEEDNEMEEKQAMLNLVMNEVLRKFREENGRGPDTRELLEIRKQVADSLGVEVATSEALEAEGDESSKKRKANGDGEKDTNLEDSSQRSSGSSKKVKFVATEGEENEEEKGGDSDKKPAAATTAATAADDDEDKKP